MSDGADDVRGPDPGPGPETEQPLEHQPRPWPPADQGAPAEPEAPSPPPQPARPDELLTVSQVAERAGVHENTVRKHLKAASIPFFLRDLATGEIVSSDIPQRQWPARYQYLLPAEVVAHLASQTGDTVAPAAPRQAAEPAVITSSEVLSQEALRLRAELSTAERALSTAHEQLQELRTERDWLRSHLRDITAFLPAAREESEHVRSDLQSSEAELRAVREHLERLRDEAHRLQRQQDLDRQARRTAAIRFKSLSWWRRLHTDLETLIHQELTRLSQLDTDSPSPDS
jgi:predicted transcriptional regulator